MWSSSVVIGGKTDQQQTTCCRFDEISVMDVTADFPLALFAALRSTPDMTVHAVVAAHVKAHSTRWPLAGVDPKHVPVTVRFAARNPNGLRAKLVS